MVADAGIAVDDDDDGLRAMEEIESETVMAAVGMANTADAVDNVAVAVVATDVIVFCKFAIT